MVEVLEAGRLRQARYAQPQQPKPRKIRIVLASSRGRFRVTGLAVETTRAAY